MGMHPINFPGFTGFKQRSYKLQETGCMTKYKVRWGVGETNLHFTPATQWSNLSDWATLFLINDRSVYVPVKPRVVLWNLLRCLFYLGMFTLFYYFTSPLRKKVSDWWHRLRNPPPQGRWRCSLLSDEATLNDGNFQGITFDTRSLISMMI